MSQYLMRSDGVWAAAAAADLLRLAASSGSAICGMNDLCSIDGAIIIVHNNRALDKWPPLGTRIASPPPPQV